MGSRVVFLPVAQAITVGIQNGIGGVIDGEAVLRFPNIGHSVAVSILGEHETLAGQIEVERVFIGIVADDMERGVFQAGRGGRKVYSEAGAAGRAADRRRGAGRQGEQGRPEPERDYLRRLLEMF